MERKIYLLLPFVLAWMTVALNLSAQGAATANTWTWTTINSNGYKVGQALFLPAAGWRTSTGTGAGGKGNKGGYGMYWSSTADPKYKQSSYNIMMNYNGIYTTNTEYRSIGASVRCVSE